MHMKLVTTHDIRIWGIQSLFQLLKITCDLVETNMTNIKKEKWHCDINKLVT